MHVEALKRKASNDPDKRDIFQAVLNICAFNPTPETLEKLSDCKCLPVKLKSGIRQWCDRSGRFAIVDRREYERSFAGKIDVLDFSMEETHAIKPFLLGLGLEERYMSKAVKEETKALDGSIDQRLTQDLRKKAYAICR